MKALADYQHSDLVDAAAVRSTFEAAVKASDPTLLVFYDHGSEDAWWGSDGKKLMDYSNVGLVSGREVYTMACLCARKLGAEAYRKGCRAFWGYTEPFSFTTDQEAVFGKLANKGLLLNIKKGKSWAEAVESVKAAFTDEVDRLQKEGGNGWAVVALINDRDSLVCWTSESQPPSDCPFRRAGINLFGRPGQRMTKGSAVAMILIFTLYFTALYGYIDLMYSQYNKMVLDMGYAAFLGLFLAEVLMIHEYMKSLDRK